MNSIKVEDPPTNILMCGGCLTKVAILDFKNVKIGSKTVECVFFRYA
jgi:hypothetical protein